jgi:hypothetical protein
MHLSLEIISIKLLKRLNSVILLMAKLTGPMKINIVRHLKSTSFLFCAFYCCYLFHYSLSKGLACVECGQLYHNRTFGSDGTGVRPLVSSNQINSDEMPPLGRAVRPTPTDQRTFLAEKEVSL